MKILVTGGAGYIGSHFIRYLRNSDINEIVVLDNLSRGHKEALPGNIKLEQLHLSSPNLVALLNKYKPDIIVHFAAFAYVGESVEEPAKYYENNVIGTLNLLNAMKDSGINKVVFSSTCSVYGNSPEMPLAEDSIPNPINPYAKSKYFIEKMLEDFSIAYGLKYVALRYFNAAGCDFDGMIGESHEPEPHLIPRVLNTALGKHKEVLIFGGEYDTPDGTCVRDYIHVNDLASAHKKAVDWLMEGEGSEVFNLGTGVGNSVKEIIDLSAKISGRDIISKIVAARTGDPVILIADSLKAKKMLNWQPQFEINDIIVSAWKWFSDKRY